MHGNQRRPIARQVDSEIEYLKHDDHDTIDIVFRIFFFQITHIVTIAANILPLIHINHWAFVNLMTCYRNEW